MVIDDLTAYKGFSRAIQTPRFETSGSFNRIVAVTCLQHFVSIRRDFFFQQRHHRQDKEVLAGGWGQGKPPSLLIPVERYVQSYVLRI